jgi:hypothetical protein
MNPSFTALVAVGLALSVAAVAKGKPPEAALALAVLPTAKTEVRTDGNHYRLRSITNLACGLIRGAAADDGSYSLRADLDCERLLPGLSEVRFWQERDDGVIVFSRNGADDVITFAVADGVAYESFRPASALISLAADD